MPLLDLPLESLRAYAGRNPRPDDFDAYWERTLAETEALDPAPERRPAEFQVPFARCEHLYFTGLGGARVHAKLLIPTSGTGHRGLMHFHGYTGRSAEWSEYLGHVAGGAVVAALDCRGQAGLSEDVGGVRGGTHSGHIVRGLDDGPDRLYYRHVFADTYQLARVVKSLPEVDAGRLGAWGGSQGGALALVCAALTPEVRRVAAMHPFLSDYRRVWEMDLAKGAYEELRTFFRQFDPRHEREDEIFTRLGYIDIAHLTPRVEAEVLMGIGLADDITPPSTCYAAFNRITGPKHDLVYPDFRHEALPGYPDRAYSFLMGL